MTTSERVTTDVFGTPRFGCRLRGCGCTEYVTPVDAMTSTQRAEVEAQYHVLTCQRKSELTLWCTCGHPSWEHTQRRPPAADARDESANGTVGLVSVLQQQQPSLVHLRSALAAETLDSLCSQLGSSGRVAFLRMLRDLGVSNLADRQALANAVSRESREREAAPPSAHEP